MNFKIIRDNTTTMEDDAFTGNELNEKIVKI